MSKNQYETEYSLRYPILKKLAASLEVFLKDQVNGHPRIDRITARAKEPTRFLEKCNRMKEGIVKYTDPMNEIQDQLAARIITLYLCDIDEVCKLIEAYFGSIESRRISPESATEFGYEGHHYILLLPKDVVLPYYPKEHCPEFFELQIKTLFQYAWSEADHDLGYKPNVELTREQRKKIAFTAAQSWGADLIFNELFMECTRKPVTET